STQPSGQHLHNQNGSRCSEPETAGSSWQSRNLKQRTGYSCHSLLLSITMLLMQQKFTTLVKTRILAQSRSLTPTLLPSRKVLAQPVSPYATPQTYRSYKTG